MWAPGATWQSTRTASTGSTARSPPARVRPQCTACSSGPWECGVGRPRPAGGPEGRWVSWSRCKEEPSWPEDFHFSCWSFSEMGTPGSLSVPFPWQISSTRISASAQFPHASSFIGRGGNSSSVASQEKHLVLLWMIYIYFLEWTKIVKLSYDITYYLDLMCCIPWKMIFSKYLIKYPPKLMS